MPEFNPRPHRVSSPQPALQAVLSDAAADPVRRALWLETLDQQFRLALPSALSGHCRLGNVIGGKLVFLVESSAWASKLRLSAPELVQLAQSLGLAITEVSAKIVTPACPVDSPTGLQVKPMSDASRDALQAALASLNLSPAESPPEPTTSKKSNARNRRDPR